MYLLISVVCGYLFGCLNGSQLIGNYKRVSVKEKGMKNAGATNTTLVLGFKYGLAVLFIDIVKAIISLYFIAILLTKYNIAFDYQMLLLYMNGLFVIVGHNFPVTMGFAGGKGTASVFGVLLFIDMKFAIMGFCIMLIFAFVSNYFVVGTLMLYLSFVAYTAFTFEKSVVFVAFLFMLLFLIKHAENFKRIFGKEEVKVSTLFHKEVS